MNIQTHILNAGGNLTRFIPVIQRSSQSAIKKITKLIPVDNIDIVIYENARKTIEHIGFSGFAMTRNLVMIPMNTSFKDLKKSIENRIEMTMAHELYHCLRNYTYEGRYNLLEALINEGLAEQFAVESTGEEPGKWANALTKNQFNTFYKRAEKEFFHSNYNHWAWFYGSKKEKIPRWAGYTIGFMIVGNYLKNHPREKPSTLYKTDVKEFI